MQRFYRLSLPDAAADQIDRLAAECGLLPGQWLRMLLVHMTRPCSRCGVRPIDEATTEGRIVEHGCPSAPREHDDRPPDPPDQGGAS